MDFEAIDRYLSFCNKTADSSDDVLLGLDQKVPQSNLVEEDVMFSDEKLGKDIRNSAIMQVFLADDLPMMDPTPSNGPVYVSEVSEQSVHRGGSPAELYDLDQNSGHDITLYDDSIRIKQEPGLDIKKECEEPPCHNYQNPAFYQCEEQIFRNMETQIIQDLKSDIEAACRYLKIGSDPMCWSPSDVQKWVAWQCAQYNVHDCKPEYFQMNGANLCSLSEDDFKRLALSPLAGTTLYSQLDIWRSACDLPVGQTTYPYASYQPHHHQQQHFNVFQIPVPSVSPTPSSDSDDDSMSGSSQGSTSPHMIRQREEDYQGFYSRSADDKLPDDMDHKQTIQLWQFLKQLLLRPDMYNSCIKWVDRSRGIFKIEDSARVARLWGRRKNRPAMNYDKLSRSIRQYYKKGIIKKTEHSKRLVYQFCQPYL